MYLEFLHEEYRELDHLADKTKKNPDLTTIKDQTFKDLKQAWYTIRQFLTSDSIPSEDQQLDFIRKTLGVSDDGGDWQIVTGKNQSSYSLLQRARNMLVGDSSSGKPLYWDRRRIEVADQEFIASLEELESAFPVLGELASRIKNCLKEYLHKTGAKIYREHMDKTTEDERKRQLRVCSDLRSERHRSEMHEAAMDLYNQLKTMMPPGTS